MAERAGFADRLETLRRPERTHHLPILALSLAILAAGVVCTVERNRLWIGDTALPGSCWLAWVLPHGCPGCGLTRSIVAAFHGRWRESLALHPAGWLVALMAVSQVPYRCLHLAGRRLPPWTATAGRRIMLVVLIISLAQWVGRLVLMWYGEC